MPMRVRRRPWGGQAHGGQGPGWVVEAAEHEPAARLGVEVHVVAADAVDRPGVEQVLDGGLDQPQVGQHAQQDQGRQQGQGE
jgi:hypothetical protein